MMNSTLIDFNTCKHSILMMFVIGFVILIPYSLPPWLVMKEPYFMLPLLILGSHQPGNEIDIYLKPLVDELKELWEEGVETYDTYSKKNF